MATVGTALKALRKVDRELGETLDDTRKMNPEMHNVFERLAALRVSVQQEIGKLKDSEEPVAEDGESTLEEAEPVTGNNTVDRFERKVADTHGKPADSGMGSQIQPPSTARPVIAKEPLK